MTVKCPEFLYVQEETAAHAIVVELVYTLDLKSNALTEIVSSSLTDSIVYPHRVFVEVVPIRTSTVGQIVLAGA